MREWKSDHEGAGAVHLLADGSVIRLAHERKLRTPFHQGGIRGGRIQRINWGGELTWNFLYAGASVFVHDSLVSLPNGNVLALAWNRLTPEEAAAKGRNSESISPAGLWTDTIIEFEPNGPTLADTRWLWRSIDHLVQDEKTSAPGHGDPSEHPDRIDLNQRQWKGAGSAWPNLTDLAYLPESDQIAVVSQSFGELWFLDHSTSIEQSIQARGGDADLGGRLLQRWRFPGPPAARSPQEEEKRKIASQFRRYGLAMLPSNQESGNGEGRSLLALQSYQTLPPASPSQVWELAFPPVPPRDQNSVFVDLEEKWTYSQQPFDFGGKDSLPRITSVQRLPEGRTLLCFGDAGELAVIDANGKEIWRYESPYGPIPDELLPKRFPNVERYQKFPFADVSWYPKEMVDRLLKGKPN